ncbi:Gag-like protein [Plakobranchus ocellatus]|uniref:Gag-like protein n=1 Tax=Plakobranchus ocellatus TaxID=259542 RepID=A0AAV3XY79_9GAST|nr:Gag-like protein [Plakobranchus ocellatus]
MVISSKGSAKVADRSPFKIHRELKLILGDETIEVTKLGSGDLMVELKSNDQAKKLGAIATFLDIPVTVSPHKSLNSSKGVIRSRDLRCCSEEEMVEELSGVTHARRIKVRRGEDKIQTDTVVLTFDSPKPPSRIRAGYLTLDVRPYVPLPMRCYKCQRYGHGKDRCKKPATVCVRCGKGGHVERDCSADPHCVNCREDQAASSKTCPKFLEEQAILRYKAENGGTFQQAQRGEVREDVRCGEVSKGKGRQKLRKDWNIKSSWQSRTMVETQDFRIQHPAVLTALQSNEGKRPTRQIVQVTTAMPLYLEGNRTQCT